MSEQLNPGDTDKPMDTHDSKIHEINSLLLEQREKDGISMAQALSLIETLRGKTEVTQTFHKDSLNTNLAIRKL